MVAPLVSLLGRFDDGNDRVENIGLVSLDDVSTHDHLVDYKVRLLYVKHYIELTNVFEVLVQRLDHVVDEL